MADSRFSNTWASRLFIDSKKANRTLQVQIDNITINISGGNGLRLQSDDAVTGGDGLAVSRVVIGGFSIKTVKAMRYAITFDTEISHQAISNHVMQGAATEFSSNLNVSCIVIRDCLMGLLIRYYPVEVTKLAFDNISIAGNGATAIYVQRNLSNTTQRLGEIRFSNINIYNTVIDTGAIDFSGGLGDVALNNITIRGSYPVAAGGALVRIRDIRHVMCDGFRFIGTQGVPSSYIRTEASQSTIVKNVTAVSHFGEMVGRPFEIGGEGQLANITCCVVPVTTSPDIGYPNPAPAQRYEYSNQFAISEFPQHYTLTNAETTREKDADNVNLQQLANLVAAHIADRSYGKFVSKD